MSTSFGPKLLVIVIIICLQSAITSCSGNDATADLVLKNGRIITLEDDHGEISAIAIKGDSIIALSSEGDIDNLINNDTKVIDLAGRTAIPGFIDSHAHFMSLGKSKLNLDLRDARNFDEIIAMVVQAAESLNPGDWITGRGWHQEKWDPKPNPNVNGYPVNDILSQAVPFNPVILTHASGHALLANARAMELSGVTDSTVDPPGGKIVRDSLGHAIGVFEEEAESIVQSVYNKFLSGRSGQEILSENMNAAKLANEECIKKGITSLHDAGASFSTIDLYKNLIDANSLDIRLYVMIGEDNSSLKKKINGYKIIGYGNNHLTVRSIKKYIDGALGSRGAWLLESYTDLPEHSGLNVTPLHELYQTANIAFENGFQMCTHAIGDRGVREILNIYESVINKSNDKNLRWRVEHSQHISSRDIQRYSQLGVIAAMQGIHCTSDAAFVTNRLGDKRAKENSYSWRKLIDAGCVICNGTDAPVEDVDPLKSFYASVTRKLTDGTTFYPGQKMTRLEALKSYTINGAYAAFEENIKGTLRAGKLADIVVLSNNILEVSDNELLNTKIEMTIIGGKVVYSKASQNAVQKNN